MSSIGPYVWLFDSFQAMGRLVGCVQSSGLSARVSRLRGIILLVSFSDNLLVVLILDIFLDGRRLVDCIKSRELGAHTPPSKVYLAVQLQ